MLMTVLLGIRLGSLNLIVYTELISNAHTTVNKYLVRDLKVTTGGTRNQSGTLKEPVKARIISHSRGK